MKIVEVKTCDGLRIMFWLDGALMSLHDALEMFDRHGRGVILRSLARHRKESLAQRVDSYFARATERKSHERRAA